MHPTTSGQYVVVARRYRPQDFQQLVGQSQVSQALANAITTNRVGHAYLFTGARGVGKTSTARIFSKCLNCASGPTTTPCGGCDSCEGIASGDDVDVIEIDGASNRGIDEIRQLRSNVNIRPSRARFKIYIIDEVHMLTTPAFNALLKTLEEPPEHVKFIFCTTEADKIPITVLSRCQRFDFAPLETKAIVDRLAKICSEEGVTSEEEALQIVARRASGSMRDSQSLLEQLLSLGGQRITVSDVHAMLGTARSSRLASLVDCLVRRDAAAALTEVEAAVNEGVDLGQLAEQLLGYLRDAMAAQVGCPEELLLNTTRSEAAAVKQTGEQFGLNTLLAIAQILDQTLVRLRQSTHVRTLVEMALVRICKLEDLDLLPCVVAQLRDGAPVDLSTQQRASAARGTIAAPPKATQSDSAEKKTPGAEGQQEDTVGVNTSPFDGTTALTVWRKTLDELKDMTGEFASKYSGVAISGPNRLVVEFRKDYTTAKEFCERPERRSRLEQILSRVAGRDLRIDFALSADESQVPVSQGVANRQPAKPRERRTEVQRNPLVRLAVDSFDAELVTIIDPSPSEEVAPSLSTGGEPVTDVS